MENNGNGMKWVALISAVAGGSWEVHKYRSRAVINVASRFVNDFGSIYELSGKEVTVIVFPIKEGDEWEFLNHVLKVNDKPITPERELIDLPKKRKRK